MMIINRKTLKWIGLFSMLADHISMVFFTPQEPVYAVLRTAGRLAAPSMCFLLAEGFVHTSSRKKYGQRMLFFAFLSQAPFCLIQKKSLLTPEFNMLFTLFLCLVLLQIYTGMPSGSRKELYLFLLTAATCFCDWGLTAQRPERGFFAFRGNKKKQAQVFSIVSGGTLLLEAAAYLSASRPWTEWFWQAGIFLFIPFLLLYSDEASPQKKSAQNFFYLFYPAHMLLLSLLSGRL